MVFWKELLTLEKMVAPWATEAKLNSFESELSNGNLGMVQKGPAHLGAQQARLNSLL